MCLFHELAYLLIHLRTDQNCATSYRQCTELSVSRSNWSRGVMKHLYDYIRRCMCCCVMVGVRVRACVHFICVLKIRIPSTVLSRFLLFLFCCMLGSNIPFEVVLCCFVNVLFDYDVFIRFRWQATIVVCNVNCTKVHV